MICLLRKEILFSIQENIITDGEGSGGDLDDHEVTDECAMLIHADHMNKHMHLKDGQEKMTGIVNWSACVSKV
jgi:hypothetical protein